MKARFGVVVFAAMVQFFTAATQAQHAGQFRGDNGHTGAYAGAAPANISHVLWRFQTGARILSSPVVADGILYVGSNDHFLHALDARKGTELWKFKTGADVTSTPAVTAGMVYFLSLDGNAYALNAQTGELKWKFETEGEARHSAAGIYGSAPSREMMPDAWDFFLSSPAVAEGIVYFGSGDHCVYALDAATGKLIWKYRGDSGFHSSPAISRGVVYIGCWDSAFYALDARTGQLKWKFATGLDGSHLMEGIPGSAAVSQGIVVFGSRDGNTYALEEGTGKRLWAIENDHSWVISSPAIVNGVAYTTTSDSLKFSAVELKTGRVIFEVPYGTYSFSSPAIVGNHAYFGTFDGIVHDVDLVSHRMNSEFRVQASLDRKDLLTSDGHLNQGAVYGPLGPDGQPDNTLDATMVGIDRLLQLGSILASPCAADGIVYVASADGAVYALD